MFQNSYFFPLNLKYDIEIVFCTVILCYYFRNETSEKGDVENKSSEAKSEFKVTVEPAEEIMEVSPPNVPPVHPDLPALKAGHIWSFKENQAIFKHLYPRVELAKLKYEKHYFKKLKVNPSEEDLELDQLISQLNSSNVIELANGVEAIIQANGDTLVLPPDYKQKVEVRRKILNRWRQESTYAPPIEPTGKKLNIANVKFGRTLKHPKIVLKKIVDVK